MSGINSLAGRIASLEASSRGAGATPPKSQTFYTQRLMTDEEWEAFSGKEFLPREAVYIPEPTVTVGLLSDGTYGVEYHIQPETTEPEPMALEAPTPVEPVDLLQRIEELESRLAAFEGNTNEPLTSPDRVSPVVTNEST